VGRGARGTHPHRTDAVAAAAAGGDAKRLRFEGGT